jgi:hypothetical protein
VHVKASVLAVKAAEIKRRKQVALLKACRNFLYAAGGLFWVSNACAACRLDTTLTVAMMNDFLQKPELMLSGDASSQRSAQELKANVTKFAAAAPAAVRVIKTILARATHQQRTVIGQGLYAAVASCRAVDPATATRIETAVKSIGNSDVMLAYQLAANSSVRPAGDSNPKLGSGFGPAEPSGRSPGLIGAPTPADPGSLKLADPFGPPDAWR